MHSVAYLRRPQATVQELMEHIAGPDFPRGGHNGGANGDRGRHTCGDGAPWWCGGVPLSEEIEGKAGRTAIVITEVRPHSQFHTVLLYCSTILQHYTTVLYHSTILQY